MPNVSPSLGRKRILLRSQSEDLDGNLSSGTSSAHSVQRGRSASPLHGMSSRTMYLCPVIAWAGSWASASYACTTESSTTWRPAGSVSSCSSAITHFVMGPRLAQRQPLPTIASAEGWASGRLSHLPQSRRLTRSAPIPTQTLPRCSRRRARSPPRTKDSSATTPPTAAPQVKPAPNSLEGAARTTPTKNSTSRTT